MASKPQEVARYSIPLSLERSRHWNVKTMRDGLVRAFQAAGVEMRQSVFDAWLFATLLDTTQALLGATKLADFNMEMERDSEGAPRAQDVVVPKLECGLQHLDAALAALGTLTADQMAAIRTAFEPELRQRVKHMSSAILKAPHVKEEEPIELVYADNRLTIGRIAVSLREPYRAKLLTLYRLFGHRTGEGFDNALAVLLMRYDGLGGGSFQCSLPPPVFDTLKADFGVFFECFASPLNAHFPRYCSAFEDTDFAFGSLGSFFQFRPTEGSFEAHPPPVQTLVDAMVAHMDDLLLMTKKPLSFVVILSAAGESSPLWQAVRKSRYCTHVEALLSHRHCFTEGLEHRRKDATLKLGVRPSAVFWLQNEGAAQRWAVKPEALARLHAAFAGRDPKSAEAAAAPVSAPAAAAAAKDEPTSVAAAAAATATSGAARPPISSNWKQLQQKLTKRTKH